MFRNYLFKNQQKFGVFLIFLFRKLLALGKSKAWPEALSNFTGSDKMTSAPMKEYFAPLSSWLKQYRQTHNYKLGWDEEQQVDAATT